VLPWRAIVIQPDVLLLDEPLSNLDAKIRMRIRFELKALQKRLKIPTLYVTHDQEEALSIADKIAIMHNGKVLQVGTPEEVYKNPVDLFIADFIGVNSVVKVKCAGEKLVEVGNLKLPVQKETVYVVIRAEETKVLPIQQRFDIAEGDLRLEGTIIGKLYLGSKYRYEIKIEGVDEVLFINSEEVYNVNEQVQIISRKGNFFIYEQ